MLQEKEIVIINLTLNKCDPENKDAIWVFQLPLRKQCKVLILEFAGVTIFYIKCITLGMVKHLLKRYTLYLLLRSTTEILLYL